LLKPPFEAPFTSRKRILPPSYSRTSVFLSHIARSAMNFSVQRVLYAVPPSVTGPSADLTILFAAVCVVLELMRTLCALSTPGEPDDPTYSISIASSFGAGGP
jgi:hypothetical protein